MRIVDGLKLDWCSHEAAVYATRHWHYSRSMPVGRTAKLGVWENAHFIGAVVFAHGAQQNIGRPFGLSQFECSELCRVALDRHATPVSRILRIALRLFKAQSPGVRAVVSYADIDRDHHGGIYQAAGWLYLGKVERNGGTPRFRINGTVMHARTVHSRWGKGSQRLDWIRVNIDPKAERVLTFGKHKYFWPFDDEIRRRVLPIVQPYPKRVRSADSGMAIPIAGGGANPTRTLHRLEEAS